MNVLIKAKHKYLHRYNLHTWESLKVWDTLEYPGVPPNIPGYIQGMLSEYPKLPML